MDLPGGGGKVTLQPTYLLGEGEQGGRGHWLRNHRGERYFYPEPPERDCTCPYEKVYYDGAGGAVDGARGTGRAAPLAPGPDGATWLTDHAGRRGRYPEPPDADCSCAYDAVYYGAGPPAEGST